MSDDFDFLGKLRGQLQYAIQWLPKGSIGPMQVRPSATVGQVLTTTANGAEWQDNAGGGGVSDHGALTGLADDDHTQYHNDARGDARYWQLSTDLATQAELDAHINDTTDAHDASAISILDAAADFTATDVEGALAELAIEKLDSSTAASTYQPLDADLTTIAALDSGTSTGVMATEAAGWVKRTYAQVKTSLGLVKADVGLGNVDNTSDANKPVSTAQQSALDLKANLASPTFTGTVTASGATAVTVPTVAIGAGSNAATIGAVNTALGAYLTTSSASSTYMPLAGGTGTGTWDLDAATSVLVPTATSTDSSTKAASTAFVKSQRMSDLTLPNAAVPMNSQKFTGLAAGSANGDSLRYEQLFTTSNVGLLAGLNAAFGYAVNVGVTAGSPQAQLGAAGGASTVGLYSDYSHTQPMTMLSSYSGLSFGAGGSSSVDWNLSRTAANEATIAAGDVLKHDTPAESDNSTKSATTAYVDRATGNASSSRPMVNVARTTSQSLAIATWTAIQFDTELTDTDSMWTSGANTRLTATTAGNYIVTGHVGIDNTASNQTHAARLVHKNSAGTVQAYYAADARYGAVDIDGPVLSKVLALAAGDYVEFQAYSSVATNTAVFSNTHHASFSMAWVGGTGAAWGNAGASVYGPSAAVANTTETTLSFASETFDIDGMHSTSVNTNRLTCVTPGTYEVKCRAYFDAVATTGPVYVGVKRNGTIVNYNSSSWVNSASIATIIELNHSIQMVAGDYLEMVVYQGTGASRNLNVGAAATSFSAVRVGYQTNPADLPGTYIASMYAANSGTPTHTTSGSEQKVGSGGGTLTWTSDIDKRPSGVAAQVDTATNKRIDIRKTGLYRVTGSVGFAAISDAKAVSVAVYKNGARVMLNATAVGKLVTPVVETSKILSLTSGDYLELYGNQDDSASEAYFVGLSTSCMLQAEYLGPAS